MTISQKDGVFNAVEAFLAENSRSIEAGTKVELTATEKKTVVVMLVSATQAGELTVRSEKANADLNKYWDGTLRNWLAKDIRLNGGEKHTIKNPGSRTGQGDKALKNLKLLMAKLKGTEHESAVQAEINNRVDELAEMKVKNVEVDFSILPSSLQHLG